MRVTCESALVIKIATFFLNEMFRTFEGTLEAWSSKQDTRLFMTPIANFRLAKFGIDLFHCPLCEANNIHHYVKTFTAGFDLFRFPRGDFSVFEYCPNTYDRIMKNTKTFPFRRKSLFCLRFILSLLYSAFATTISRLQNLLVESLRFWLEL